MPYYRFQNEDIFHNVIKAYPKVRFDIYGGVVYYNGAYKQSGSFTGSVPCVPSGHINLYEMNVDRERPMTAAERAGTEETSPVPQVHQIDAFISKDGTLDTFKTIATSDFNESEYGAEFRKSYALSASISREYYGLDTNIHLVAGETSKNRFVPRFRTLPASKYKKIDSDLEPNGINASSSFVDGLKNVFDYYTNLSAHYAYSASHPAWDFGTYDKGHQEINMIYLPSIFYGTSIKKGSVSLKWYVSGSLMAECRDREENGELIQVTGSGRPAKDGETAISPTAADSGTSYAKTVLDGTTGSVAGVVLYNEGIIALTGSWGLVGSNSYKDRFRIKDGSVITTKESPKWTYFGLGANDNSGSVVSTTSHNISSSFTIEFQGTSHIPVTTMFAHAPKGYLNFSNNPTFVSGTLTANSTGAKMLTGSDPSVISGEAFYKEDNKAKVKNVVSSSFANHTASYKSSVFISKVGIFDDNMNLIGIATLANPVKKTEEREFTFKLKLDY